MRKQHGVIGWSVNHLVRQPNTVITLHQAETIAELRAMFHLPQVHEAMKNAGVKGTPSIELVEVVAAAAMY
jgi:hypothetical protein